jgi:hypothetical protein
VAACGERVLGFEASPQCCQVSQPCNASQYPRCINGLAAGPQRALWSPQNKCDQHSFHSAPTRGARTRGNAPHIREAQGQPMSLIETDNAPARPQKERISRRLRHALDLLASGDMRNIKDAADKAGLCREHLSRSMRKSHIQAFIAQRTREILTRAQLRASRRLEELIDSDSANVSLHATVQTLRMNGHMPQEGTNVLINNSNSVGYQLILRGEPGELSEGISAKPNEITTTYQDVSGSLPALPTSQPTEPFVPPFPTWRDPDR